jgi:hypothetical protein
MTDTPQLTHAQVAEIAQEHEDFLNQLKSLAISAIASGNWWPVYDHETARIAAGASYLAPKDRTPDQQQAKSKVSKAIASNNQK